jgi:large subunit ribosomal protein L10
MTKLKAQKERDLQELTDLLKTAKAAVFSDYRGTTVKSMDKIRRILRAEKVFTKVYKITLLKKALQAIGINAAGIDYKVPVILSISQEDETTPARSIKQLAKELQTIKVLEGVLGGQLVDKNTIEALADLPSKKELRARLVSAVNAPRTGLVNVLAGNLRGLMNVLSALTQNPRGS